ncbi:E3 ubiquitin-protein ligase znrf1 [Larimichthys crocea]|uniref:RING-type E3 ubiquitin transferase n=1 Tax=Larimichthys crocea TaxID=215358 RepID=A0A6G0IW94_LARCR|nr:E3 ubiquitin-protein ligase znrf1 [Larimichthys crocea]
MGGKQSTAGRPRGAFPGVSTDDSAVPPSAHFGHYRPSGTMGLRSRSVSSVAGMGIEHSPAVPFGFYTPRGTDSDRAGGGGGGGSGGTTAGTPHGGGTGGYQETGGGGHHTDGVLYLGSRGSLADTLPLHIAPRWFSAHSGFKCPVCSKSVASNEMEVHFIMCLSKPRLSYNDDVLARDAGECVICLEELQQGDTIARLPCLCIYHKRLLAKALRLNSGLLQAQTSRLHACRLASDILDPNASSAGYPNPNHSGSLPNPDHHNSNHNPNFAPSCLPLGLRHP